MISVIIPVYNEAELMEQQLNLLLKRTSRQQWVKEILVVDGGSSDTTREIAARIPFINLLFSEKGRAKQMNTGARHATQSILYFLHIDATPPQDYDQYIVESVKKNRLAGCFCMKLDSTHPWLILMSWFTKVNHKACRGGDQSLFISKNLFEEIGGYDETYTIYEDNILIAELYKKRQFTVIQQWIVASARMYEKVGVARLQWIYLMIYLKKMQGAHPDEMYSYFKNKLKNIN